MKPIARRSASSTLLLLGLFAACGGDEDGPETAAGAPREAPAESTVPVLDQEDLAGLEEENVAFNLQWVSGPVNRQPASNLDTVRVEEVTTTTTGGFDRVVFRFPDGYFPGYEVEWQNDPPVDCATGEAADVPGERHLRVRLRTAVTPAAAAAGQRPGHPNLRSLAHTCTQGGSTDWVLGLEGAAQVRVIEMREPLRLIVDVQHADGRSD